MKKLIISSILILSLSIGNAIASTSHTLIPEFTPGQHIYLDSLIKNHPAAPFDFSGPFKNKVDSSNVYVVASQEGEEPIPEGKKLGVAKVDELIVKWAGNSQFDKQDYVAIFWVRRADDTSKGSVGANVGATQRNNGITPSALNEIVATSLKANMPQDPEGAIADIATTIETEMVEYQQAQLKAKQEQERNAEAMAARKLKTEAFFKSANEFGNNLIKAILVVSPFGIIGAWLSNRRKRRRELEAQANSLIAQWEKVLDNAGTFYTELTEKYLGELEVLDIAKCDETFQLACQKAIGEVAFFMDMKQQGDRVLEDSKFNLDFGDFKHAVHLLTEHEVQITGDKVPLPVATLLNGPNRVAACKSSEFLGRLDKQFETAKGDLILILDQYNSIEEKYKYLESLLKETEDYLAAKFYTKDSYFNLNDIEIKAYKIDISEGIRLLSKAKTAFEQYDITKLYEAKGLLMKWSEDISNVKKKAIATYEACEKGLRSLPSVDSLQNKIAWAKQTGESISRDFPSYPFDESDTLDGYKVDIAKYADAWPKMKSLYEQADFEALLELVRIYQDMCDRISVRLDVIIHKPTELKNLQSIKSNYLQEQKRKANKLRRYNWDSRTETQVNQYLAIGDFTQAEALLSSLDSEIASAKRTEEPSYSSSSYSSSGWASSSCDYGSSSSSSDYGSSSSSSDYGSSSGGSDY